MGVATPLGASSMSERPDSLILPFHNEGSSCFINATLSALAPLAILGQHVRYGKGSSKVCKQLQDAHPQSNAGTHAVRAHCFLSKPFYQGVQEDTHVFFMQLMDDADPNSAARVHRERTMEHANEEVTRMF